MMTYDMRYAYFERFDVDEVLTKSPHPVAFFISTDLFGDEYKEEYKRRALEFLNQGWRAVLIIFASYLEREEGFWAYLVYFSNRFPELMEFKDRVYLVDSFYDPIDLITTFCLRCKYSDVEYWPPIEHPASEVDDEGDIAVKELGFYRRRG